MKNQAVLQSISSLSPEVTGTRARLGVVAYVLEGYAQRGVFRGFSQEVRSTKAIFRLLWHRERVFELVFEPEKNTLRIASVLPNMGAEMYRNLQEFINVRLTSDLPDHRRIDPRKVQIQPTRRSGNVALTLRILDGDDEYAVRKFIHLVHEIFLTFLLDGRYYDYMVENFDLDPDRI
ncbi:MAG TPA: hypothetical protein VFZ34_28375 [Blastocatellia bacterium]|nr:hypothetical protein [Blastocatellia bacterium]